MLLKKCVCAPMKMKMLFEIGGASTKNVRKAWSMAIAKIF